MKPFFIKRHDTAPSVQIAIKGTNGLPVDLTDATAVNFHMKAEGSNQLKVNRAAAILTPRTSGLVRYDWQASDTDTAGKFEAEVEITWNTGASQTFPNSGFAVVQITADLDNS